MIGTPSLLPSFLVLILLTGLHPPQDRQNAREEWKKRFAAVDKDDPVALWDLVEWASKEGLAREAEQTCKRILKLDPDHEEARDHLGFVLAGGKWVKKTSPEGRAALAAASAPRGEDASFAELSFEELVAGWTDENRAADEEEAKILSGALAEDITVLSSRTVSIKGPFERDLIASVLSTAERANAELNRSLGWPWDRRVIKAGRGHRLHVLFCLNEGSFSLLLNWIDGHYLPMEDEEIDRRLKNQHGIAARGHSAVAANWRYEGLDLESYVLHHLGTTYVESLAHEASPWLWEGFGIYTAVRFAGKNTVYCLGTPQYANQKRPERKGEDTALALLVKEMVSAKNHRPLKALFQLRIEFITDRDMAQSWSIIRFLIETRPKEARSFFSLYSSQDPARTLRAVFGWTFEDMEAAWLEWASSSL